MDDNGKRQRQRQNRRRTTEADRPDTKTRPTRHTEEAKEYTRTRKMTLDVKRYIF